MKYQVTQQDRDAAEALGLFLVNAASKAGYQGMYFEHSDTGSMVQAFAKHRIECSESAANPTNVTNVIQIIKGWFSNNTQETRGNPSPIRN